MIYHLRSEHKESYEDFEEKSAGCKELCELCSEREAAQIDQLIFPAFMKAASFGLFRTNRLHTTYPGQPKVPFLVKLAVILVVVLGIKIQLDQKIMRLCPNFGLKILDTCLIMQLR
jgi:hypothetical protein